MAGRWVMRTLWVAIAATRGLPSIGPSSPVSLRTALRPYHPLSNASKSEIDSALSTACATLFCNVPESRAAPATRTPGSPSVRASFTASTTIVNSAGGIVSETVLSLMGSLLIFVEDHLDLGGHVRLGPTGERGKGRIETHDLGGVIGHGGHADGGRFGRRRLWPGLRRRGLVPARPPAADQATQPAQHAEHQNGADPRGDQPWRQVTSGANQRDALRRGKRGTTGIERRHDHRPALACGRHPHACRPALPVAVLRRRQHRARSLA